VLTALLLAVVASPEADAKSLFVNGDSLAVGTQPYFPGALPGWSVRTSASISRHAFEGPGVLRSAGSLPRYLAISLGTNDDPRQASVFRSAIRETMAIAGPRRCVVWATVVRPGGGGRHLRRLQPGPEGRGPQAAQPRRRALAPARPLSPGVAGGRRRARQR
jgi:hypothetical protein